MALPEFRLSIVDTFTGKYYTPVKATNNTWSVTLETASYYLKNLPKDWDKTQIDWERNTTYMGVYRSNSSNYQFAGDGRAILLNINAIYGVQGASTGSGTVLITEKLINTESTPGAGDMWRYELAYMSEISFKDYKDDKRTQLCAIKTLDSNLMELLAAFGDTPFNIKYWNVSGGVWSPNGSIMCVHEGIKLLYSANFISAATPTNPLDYTASGLGSGAGGGILGFAGGAHGGGFGWHTLPSMAKYNITQNNGTTTYIGNDILEHFLIQGNQSPGANAPHGINEILFNGSGNSQPYTKNNFSLKALLPSGSGTIDMSVGVKGQIVGNMTVHPSGAGLFLAFVLFEIDGNDEPVLSGGNYTYQLIYQIPLTGGTFTPPNAGAFDNITFSPAPITMHYDKAYAFGIIWDNLSGTFAANPVEVVFSKLEFSIFSNYNSGASSPVNAPRFPASPFMGFRPLALLQNLVPCLNSKVSDPYGFPDIPGGTPYGGASTFLASTTKSYDNDPADTVLTSGNAISIITGQPYISISLNSFYRMCRKLWGCGLGISGNTLSIEPLVYYFDPTTQILDLGDRIANLTIAPFTNMMGANIKAGYSAVDTNQDFGVEMVHTEFDYTTPLTKIRSVIDLQETEVAADMYLIEKKRAQQTTQAIQNQSSDNPTYILEMDDSGTPTYNLPDTIPAIGGVYVDMFTPDGGLGAPAVSVPGSAYGLKQRPTAQSTDPTAATDPYISGYAYPDTALNIGLTPAKNLNRNRPLLNSVLDNLGSQYCAFRKQYQMQQNNTAISLPGISTCITPFANVIEETADFQIGSFSSADDAIFRPYLFKFDSTGGVNMYNIINSNPNGYVRFVWKGVEFKGFIWKVSQRLGDNAAVPFELLAHPSTTFSQLTID